MSIDYGFRRVPRLRLLCAGEVEEAAPCAAHLRSLNA